MAKQAKAAKPAPAPEAAGDGRWRIKVKERCYFGAAQFIPGRDYEVSDRARAAIEASIESAEPA